MISILKPVWFLAFQKTKSWLPARHVVQAGSYPRTKDAPARPAGGEDFPRTEDAEDFTRLPAGRQGQNCFWIFSENYFEMCINIDYAKYAGKILMNFVL